MRLLFVGFCILLFECLDLTVCGKKLIGTAFGIRQDEARKERCGKTDKNTAENIGWVMQIEIQTGECDESGESQSRGAGFFILPKESKSTRERNGCMP